MKSSKNTYLPERLPQRLLYAGESITIQLVGLHSGRSLIRYQPPDRTLLLVAFGQIHLQETQGISIVAEGEEVELESDCEYDITTDDVADLLLIVVRQKPAPPSPSHRMTTIIGDFPQFLYGTLQ